MAENEQYDKIPSINSTLMNFLKPISNKAHLAVSLTTSSPTISLSADPTIPSLQLIVTTRIVSSAYPTSAITLCTDMSILNNGQHQRHDGLFKGALRALQSTADPDRRIIVAFNGHPNYGTQPNIPNLRERPWMRFETVPPPDQGALIIKHDISLNRLFRFSHDLKAADVQPGEKFRIYLNPRRALQCPWWAFGDMDGDLKDKKFAKWTLPEENGYISNIFPGEERPDFVQMEKEGWIFSQHLDDLEFTEDDAGQEVVVEFVK